MAENKRILILGGLGFIGRNLFNRLIAENYDAAILTERIYQTDPQFHRIHLKRIILGSILDKELLEKTIRNFDVIYSFAGSSGASDSIKDPYHDLDTNLKGHLNILEACRKYNPNALLIFPSSRLVYGKPLTNPVSEQHPINPESIYAIHKLTTEHYYLLYQKLYGVNCIIFRVANPYGPYQRFGSNNYGILNWFIHKALSGDVIKIYGEGSQKRDFVYIEDVVELLKMSMDKEKAYGRIYNVGFGEGISLKRAVDVICKFVPGTKQVFEPWPEIDQKIETGDYISDITLLKQELGWKPSITFEEGIQKTVEFYAHAIK